MAAEKTYYVYSKLSNSQRYDEHVPGGADLPAVSYSVHIKGGTGLADKHIITPLGVRTEVTERDVESLKTNIVFQQHEKNGFVKIEAKAYDVEKVIANMGNTVDPSAPLTEADYGDEAVTGGVKVKAN